MALDLGTLAAKLKIDDSDFQKTLKKAPKDAEDAGKKLGDGVAKGVKQSGAKDVLKGVLGAELITRSIEGMLELGRSAVDSFAELQDASAAAGVVFGDNMRIIDQAASGASATLGMSKQQYIDAAITMGTFGKSAGLAGSALSGFSTQMVGLAGDMASFRGTSPDEAIEAVGAALRGEMEPIRKYGVLLDDATLRQQALQMGLIKTTKEALSPQTKVLAAQQAILKQTSDAQGDFARTSDSTANTQKILAAETANAAAAFGEKLAPALTAVQRGGIGMLQWATANEAALVPMAGTLAAVAGAVVLVNLAAGATEKVKSAIGTVKSLGAAYQALSVQARVATVAAGALGGALLVASIIYGTLAEANARAEQATSDYTESIKADTGALGENTRAAVSNRLEKDGALAAAQKLGISLSEVTDAVLGNGDAMSRISAVTKPLTDDMRDASAEATYRAQAANDLDKALGFEAQQVINGKAAYDRMTEAQKLSTTSTGDATTAATSNTTALHANASAASDAAKKLNDLVTARLKLRGDKRGLEAAIDDATAALKENGKTLDEHTPKGRANQEALDGIATAGLAVVSSLQATKAPASQVKAAMDESRSSFIKTAEKMGLSATAAKKLADKLGLIKSPKPVKVKVTWDLPGPAKIKMDGGEYTIKAPGGRYAKGGRYPAGQLALVGEMGPELIQFGSSANIYTNRQTQQMMSGGAGDGGGGTFVQVDVHVPVNPDVMGAGSELESLLAQYKGLTNKARLAFEGAR